MIDSVVDQTYSNWELCIADGSEGDAAVEAELEKYAKQDDRIKYILLEKNEGISGNTNAALELATGEYVGLFDHDDILAPNALYEVVKALQEKNTTSYIQMKIRLPGMVKNIMTRILSLILVWIYSVRITILLISLL